MMSGVGNCLKRGKYFNHSVTKVLFRQPYKRNCWWTINRGTGELDLLIRIWRSRVPPGRSHSHRGPTGRPDRSWPSPTSCRWRSRCRWHCRSSRPGRGHRRRSASGRSTGPMADRSTCSWVRHSPEARRSPKTKRGERASGGRRKL